MHVLVLGVCAARIVPSSPRPFPNPMPRPYLPACLYPPGRTGTRPLPHCGPCSPVVVTHCQLRTIPHPVVPQPWFTCLVPSTPWTPFLLPFPRPVPVWRHAIAPLPSPCERTGCLVGVLTLVDPQWLCAVIGCILILTAYTVIPAPDWWCPCFRLVGDRDRRPLGPYCRMVL